MRTNAVAGAVVAGESPALATLPQADPPADAGRKLKLIVTGGHPGDPEYGCGGTIARYTDLGHEAVLLYLNKGEWPPRNAGLSRVAEAKKACEILKARPLYADQFNSQAVVDAAHYEAFRKILEAERPDVVFTHWPIDNHADHRAISMLVYDAWLKMKKSIRTLLLRSFQRRRHGAIRADALRGYHRHRAAQAPGVLRPRQPEPGQILFLARPGHPDARARKRPSSCRGLDPPRSKPRLRPADRRCFSQLFSSAVGVSPGNILPRPSPATPASPIVLRDHPGTRPIRDVSN